MLKVLGIVAVLLAPTLAGGAVLLALRAGGAWQQRARRRSWHGSAAATVPVERLGADLRRLHRELTGLENAPDLTPGRGVRLRAVRAAYLDALHSACRALDVPVPPPAADDEPAGPVRWEQPGIYRLEAALRERGLDIRERAPRLDAAR